MSIMEVDGSLFEGGGQVLRNSIAYSHILQRPVHITRIRAGRSKSGLAEQHLKGLLLVSDMCGGSTSGAKVGSQEITLHPRAKKAGDFVARISTAGSIVLLIQAALPCALFSPEPCKLYLHGGTNATMAPQIDYLVMLLLPTLERFGARLEVDIRRRGFFPRGGGEVAVSVQPVEMLSPVDLTVRGEITRIRGLCFTSGSIPPKVAQRMTKAAQARLREHIRGVPIEIDMVHFSPAEAEGAGTGIILCAETSSGCLLGGSALGEKQVPAEAVGEKAADDLLVSVLSRACVDEYMMDQIIIFMALANGVSKATCSVFSLHTKTAIHFAEQLSGAKFEVEEIAQEEGKPPITLVTCHGIGFKNQSEGSGEAPE